MKRLVVCCDGTWNKPDTPFVTNVEKIARTVQTDPKAAGGKQQLVYYVSGVGAGSYKADKALGGAFGFGLLHNVIAAYRFLAQNYEPGDEIFIFGFSRGAYTARSVAGMVAQVGLLTKLSLVEERLDAAVHRYQRKSLAQGAFGESVDEFKHDHCNAPDIKFLGVFDTVGALGVPVFEKAPKFHDVQLSNAIKCARHALAIDEPRLKFEPTFWTLPEDSQASTDDPRVKQVWFEGAHSDIGGGYEQTGLADTTLLWMAREAHAAGLVFDVPLLEHYVKSGSDPIRHNPLSLGYEADNVILRTKELVESLHERSVFEGGRRRLSNERALSLRISSSAVTHFQEGGYSPANLEKYREATNGFADIIESVTKLPEAKVDISELGEPRRPASARKPRKSPSAKRPG